MRRTGFTLIEVTLAMFIMSAGILGLVSLYACGYRENQQSNEDVRAASAAETLMNAMVAALSSTNMTWSAWTSIGTQPENGWGDFAGDGTGTGVADNDGADIKTPPTNPSDISKTVFGKVMSAANFNASFDNAATRGMHIAIVVMPTDDRRTYTIAIRAGMKPGTLIYQSLYFSQVCFQGLTKEEEPEQ